MLSVKIMKHVCTRAFSCLKVLLQRFVLFFMCGKEIIENTFNEIRAFAGLREDDGLYKEKICTGVSGR